MNEWTKGKNFGSRISTLGANRVLFGCATSELTNRPLEAKAIQYKASTENQDDASNGVKEQCLVGIVSELAVGTKKNIQ